MPSHPSDQPSLPPGTTLLSVNNRLKRELLCQYEREQIAAGHKVWATPDIVPWSAWLQRGYTQLLDAGFTRRVLLSSHQERLIWERVVRDSATGRSLLRPGAAARTAQQAWQLVQDWCLHPEQLMDHAAEETRIYLDWQQQFLQRCADQQLVSGAELPGLLREGAREGALDLPTRLLLAGFDTYSPLQQALLDALRARGTVIEEWHTDAEAGACLRLMLADPEAEMRAATTWARVYVDRHPHAQVAIVSPQLEQQRKALTRIATELISPQALLPGATAQPAFNLSLGRPLADYPLVAQLLVALRLCQHKPLPLADIGTVLNSPFLGGHAAEWDRRAQLDALLREDGLPQISLSRLLKRARQFDRTSPAHVPLLVERLGTLQERLGQLPGQATPNAWAGHLLQLIDALGWPGDMPLDSGEFQQADKLRDTVSTLATLARVQPRMRLSDALQRLTELCEDTVFQPERGNASIQILGVLEAAGMRFDAVWLLGFSDRDWPPAARPNPLLPARLQRERGMPHASSERELQFARHLTGRLFACADQVLVSHAAMDGDREQRPSPLIAALPPGTLANVAPEAAQQAEWLYQAAMQPGPADTLPPPDALAPTRSPRGGSTLLADQAACPFRAVARHRLQARPLAEAQAAPDPALLGSLVHDLLDRVWGEIETAEHLRALDDDALLHLIEPHARASLADLGRQRPDIYTAPFVDLECARLCELVRDWLHLEQRRALPFRVLYREQRRQMHLAGLDLRLRADRIDQLDDGRLVVIDYKTGERADAKGWLDERPTELQLPLYCIDAEQPPAAALIARVHARGPLFRGQAVDDDIVPGIDAFQGNEQIGDWPALLAHWRQALHLLAGEILNGRADIAPLEKACEYCELSPLCRIGSLAGADADDTRGMTGAEQADG